MGTKAWSIFIVALLVTVLFAGCEMTDTLQAYLPETTEETVTENTEAQDKQSNTEEPELSETSEAVTETEEPAAVETPESVAAETPAADVSDADNSGRYDSYNNIIEEYRALCAVSDEEYTNNKEYYDELYPNVMTISMWYYHLYNDGDFYYTCYDINQDGQEELLIGYGSGDYYNIVDVYTYDGSNARKVVESTALGERASLTICTDGVLIFYGSGGASYGSYDFLRIAADGYSIETEVSYTEDWEAYPDTPYYNESNYLTSDEMKEILNSHTEVELSALDWTMIQ